MRGGNNVGIKYAISKDAHYVWLLNNDTIIQTDTLSKLVIAARLSSEAGLLSPIIYSYSAPTKAQDCIMLLDKRNYSMKYIKVSEKQALRNGSLLYLWGTALFIKRAVVEKVGYLNEKYFAYWEDTEYSHRALALGYVNKLVPSAIVYHKHHFTDNDTRNYPPHYFFYMTRN